MLGMMGALLVGAFVVMALGDLVGDLRRAVAAVGGRLSCIVCGEQYRPGDDSEGSHHLCSECALIGRESGLIQEVQRESDGPASGGGVGGGDSSVGEGTAAGGVGGTPGGPRNQAFWQKLFPQRGPHPGGTATGD